MRWQCRRKWLICCASTYFHSCQSWAGKPAHRTHARIIKRSGMRECAGVCLEHANIRYLMGPAWKKASTTDQPGYCFSHKRAWIDKSKATWAWFTRRGHLVLRDADVWTLTPASKRGATLQFTSTADQGKKQQQPWAKPSGCIYREVKDHQVAKFMQPPTPPTMFTSADTFLYSPLNVKCKQSTCRATVMLSTQKNSSEKVECGS